MSSQISTREYETTLLSTSPADASSSRPALPATSTSGATPTAAINGAVPAKPKPCCVCTDEKSKRDECMLFSTAADPSKDCQSTIDKYRSCMKGFGFEV